MIITFQKYFDTFDENGKPAKALRHKSYALPVIGSLSSDDLKTIAESVFTDEPEIFRDWIFANSHRLTQSSAPIYSFKRI